MKPHDWMGDLLAAYGPKPLILVEGDDDVAWCERLMALIDPHWQDRFAVEWVGGKRRVFQGCQRVPHWRGVVDRDEWDEARIAEERHSVPNVLVLPRFTAQNYWVDPDELWGLMPPVVQASRPGAQAQLKADIEARRPDWTAHGAMWRVMLRRQTGLGDLGFPQELMDAPVTDETQIMAILNRWHDHFKPQDIMAEYRTERDSAIARPPLEHYAHVIHGKRFFRQVVTLALNRAFHQPNKTAEQWATDLVAGLTAVPSDLRPLLEALLV